MKNYLSNSIYRILESIEEDSIFEFLKLKIESDINFCHSDIENVETFYNMKYYYNKKECKKEILYFNKKMKEYKKIQKLLKELSSVRLQIKENYKK